MEGMYIKVALDKVTDVTMSADEFYKSVTPFIELLEAQGYVGTTLKLAKHALTALYLFLDIHFFGFHQDISGSGLQKSGEHWAIHGSTGGES